MKERYSNFVETIEKILEERNSFSQEDKDIWNEMKISYEFVQSELDKSGAQVDIDSIYFSDYEIKEK